MKLDVELLFDDRIYRRVLKELVPRTRSELTIVTAITKETKVEDERREVVSFCRMLDDLRRRGVRLFFLFAGKPSLPFVESLLSFPALLREMQFRLCPRVHLKLVTGDGKWIYLGSANLTGAGLGYRKANRRNFEVGMVSEDPALIGKMLAKVRAVWSGEPCRACGTKKLCRKEHEKFQGAVGLSPGASD